MDIKVIHPRAFRLLAILLVGVGITFIVVFNVNSVFLAFGATLLAILFHGIGQFIHQKTSLSYAWAYGLTLLGLLLMLALLIFFASASIVSQADELAKELPNSYQALMSNVQDSSWLKRGLAYIQSQIQQEGFTFGLATASSILTGLASVLIMFILGIYVGMHPDKYIQGILYFTSGKNKSRTQTFLQDSNQQLKKWLEGKLLAMLVISILVYIGLLILGIRLALILAILAGLLSFIPNFGPIVSALPAVILGFSQGTTTGWLVLGLYALVQFVESYLLLPLIYQEKVSLPPALTLFLQVLLGTLFGIWGLALAAPLAVTGIVAAKVFKKD